MTWSRFSDPETHCATCRPSTSTSFTSTSSVPAANHPIPSPPPVLQCSSPPAPRFRRARVGGGERVVSGRLEAHLTWRMGMGPQVFVLGSIYHPIRVHIFDPSDGFSPAELGHAALLEVPLILRKSARRGGNVIGRPGKGLQLRSSC